MEQRKVKVTLPTHVMSPRKTMADKRIMINLNQYRNWQHHLKNQVKKLYEELVLDTLKDVQPFLSPIRIDYTLYRGNNRLCDVSNVLCIIDKNFCDALVSAGLIEDDNYKVVKEVRYKFGGVQKGDHYVTVEITEVD